MKQCLLPAIKMYWKVNKMVQIFYAIFELLMYINLGGYSHELRIEKLDLQLGAHRQGNRMDYWVARCSRYP